MAASTESLPIDRPRRDNRVMSDAGSSRAEKSIWLARSGRAPIRIKPKEKKCESAFSVRD
jgi:hypothetical protein